MEKARLSILVIDPRKEDHCLIRNSLERSGVPADILFVDATEQGLIAVEKRRFDLILTDHCLPSASAFLLLHELQRLALVIPVIVLTHDNETRLAREAFQRGVADFLLKEELETVSLFEVIAGAIEKGRQREEKIMQELHWKELAERDGLTGLYNHRYFIEALGREFERARRYKRPLSLLMLDLDGFKSVNDNCGHPQGDQVLRQIGRLLVQSVRFVDVVARYGGDEFAVLLPETVLQAASRLGHRMIRDLRRHPFVFEGKVYPLSASIGAASLSPGQSSGGQLLKEADLALYQAKQRGRDRIVSAWVSTDSLRQESSPRVSH